LVPVDDANQIDWAGLARPKQTRVFYMGIEHLKDIATALIAHGLPPDTPAAVVQDGVRQTQTVTAMPLNLLMENAPAYGPRPGLLIISETVALSGFWMAGIATKATATQAV
jgi:uroporphyrin-III C-methyltransferase